jgi:hypothetical protein
MMKILVENCKSVEKSSQMRNSKNIFLTFYGSLLMILSLAGQKHIKKGMLSQTLEIRWENSDEGSNYVERHTD